MAAGKGLGRGLDVLLKGLGTERESPEILMLRVDEIRPNPRQPRLEFSQEALAELAGSIREQGVLQPILVRPLAGGPRHGYELVAGERRLRAGKMAGLEEIPAMVREVTDEQSLALALIENLQRENLNALEEAKGLDQLMTTFSMNQEVLAKRVGKSRPAVANSLRLLQLPAAIQESLRTDALSAGHARALLAVSDPAVQEALWSRIMHAGLSVREAEAQATYFKEHGELPSPGPAAQTPGRARRRKRELSADAGQVEARLRERFGTKIRLTGDEVRGSITFRYDSAAELAALLGQWGVDDA